MKKEILYCEHCGAEFERDELIETEDGYFLCNECYREATHECCNCGCQVYEDYIMDSEGKEYCGDCWDSLRYECNLKPPYDEDLAYESWREEQMLGL